MEWGKRAALSEDADEFFLKRLARNLISCRKYLPEDSGAILGAFDEYLQRKISQCKSTADGRESALIQLRDRLRENIPVSVKTACALRLSDRMIENCRSSTSRRRPDRGTCERKTSKPGQKGSASLGETAFRGTVRLDAKRVKELYRCVLVLDAVIRHKDHSSATFHSWRIKAPLRRLLEAGDVGTPVLKQFVFDMKDSGLTLDCEALFHELPNSPWFKWLIFCEGDSTVG